MDNNRSVFGVVLAVVFSVVSLFAVPGPLICKIVIAAFVGLGVAWLLPTAIAGLAALDAPRRQRNEAREHIKMLTQQMWLREMRDELGGWDQSIEPFVHRLRYLAGYGALPDRSVHYMDRRDEELWRGFEIERDFLDERLLQPLRARLETRGQSHLLDHVSIQGADLDPLELAAELERVAGVVAGWRHSDDAEHQHPFMLPAAEAAPH